MAFQDVEQILLRKKEERKKRLKKRIAIASVVIIFLLLIGGVCYYLYKNHENENKKQPAPSSSDRKKPPPEAKPKPSSPQPKPAGFSAEKALETICQGTDYKEICQHSLIKMVKENDTTIQPKDALKVSISVVSDEIANVTKQFSDFKFDTPLKKAALNDCNVLLKDAKEELNSSIGTISTKDLTELSSTTPDLNNWLSAVMSYQQTCVDGFPEGKEKDSMNKLLKNMKELGSNALAMLSQASSVLSNFQVPNAKRNLLEAKSSQSTLNEDEFPSWMDEEARRMLGGNADKFNPNVTVAKDGSGNYTTISAALKALPKNYVGRYIIYVQQGVYEEHVVVTKDMENITMYGDGSQKSVITGSKNFVDGVPIYQTATFAALGKGFMAQWIGFRNTAGPKKRQAVALRVQADHSIFVNCRMEGYQDTLYAQTHRQFYRSCYITGTVDFIFGDAAAIFQNCMIYVRKPMDNQKNIVTAQGRVDRRETTGFVLQNCRILADDKLTPDKKKFKSYLGRPWKEYSRTIVMETEIGDLISPEGWLEWDGDFALKTLYYAEYNNKGPGSKTSGRVKWPGYKIIKRDEAVKFTASAFLQGESWLKMKNVPVRFSLFS